MIGYDRLEGRRAWGTLCQLYRELRLYVNFFQPSLKLLEKHRNGAQVIRHYERAQTPYQRVLAASVDSTIKRQLAQQYQTLDAVSLLSRIQRLQKELQEPAVGEFQAVEPTNSDSPPYYRKQVKKDGRKGPRHWRTRKDPFETVVDEIDQLLDGDPHQSAASVLRELIDRHPSQFGSAHIRSMQRRVIEWRQCHAERLKTLKHAMLQ